MARPLRLLRQIRRPRGGFTLMEAALVTVIIGVAVVAMLQLLAAGTMSNSYASEQATALNLANNMREIALGLPFFDPDTPTGQTPQWSTPEPGGVAACDDLLDLSAQTYSPPLDVRRQPMAGYSNWAQQVTIESVGSDAVASVRPNTTTEPTARVTVAILHNGKNVYQMSWLAVAPSP